MKRLRRLWLPLFTMLLVAAGGAEEDYLRFKTLQILAPEVRLVPQGPAMD